MMTFRPAVICVNFWIAKLRGQQVFSDALLEKGEKKMAKKIYEYANVSANTETPKKFAEFVVKFKKEVRESLQKCEQL